MEYKNVVLCADGTGNTTIKGRGTNVFKLFESVDVNGHRSDPSLRRQLAFYNDGVGTQELRWIRAFAGATGYGLSRNVKHLYRELCRVYEPGDAIYLFGFSRGAFTVRTLAGLIAECGLVPPADYESEREFRAQTRAAYKAYRRKYRALLTRFFRLPGLNADEFKARYARRDRHGRPIVPTIAMVGVWDTVDAVGMPFELADVWNRFIWQYKFNTTTLGATVEKGCHALAMNDDRASFTPVLWDERNEARPGRVEQVWFAGAHSNVGGGYPQRGMSLVALDWMMQRAEEQGLRFAPFARQQYRGRQAFADRLYDPRSGFGVFYRWKPRNVTRLCADKGIVQPKVHVSVIERIIQAPDGYAPGNVPPNCTVVATENDPLMNLSAVSEAVAVAHGGRSEPPLIERQAPWVRVKRAASLTFIAGSVAAVVRALAVGVDTSGGASAAAAVSSVFDSLPLSLIRAVALDPVAAGLLIGAVTIATVLSRLGDRRTKDVYSAFWHRRRAALRTVIRRTPAPAEDAASTAQGV